MLILAVEDAVCGTTTIPGALVSVIRTVYTLIKVAIPLILILMGMLDLGKAVISQKEDDIKKQQGIFVKRLISAALVFFVFAIVQLVVNIIDTGDTTNCANCILNNKNCNEAKENGKVAWADINNEYLTINM